MLPLLRSRQVGGVLLLGAALGVAALAQQAVETREVPREGPPPTAPDLTRWETFGLAEGLPENSVLAIHQDSLGFMWFSTQNGLARYDGAEMTVFAPDPDNPGAIPGRRVFGRMLDAPGGDLWIGTKGGLSRYDRASGRFETYTVDLQTPADGSPNNSLILIGQDARGHIWSVDYYNTLHRFDPALAETDPDAAFHRYANDPADPASLSADVVSRIPRWSFPVTSDIFSSNAVLIDSRGEVWVGTLAGLNRYDPETNGWIRYTHDPSDERSLSSDTIHNLTEGQDGSIWVSTDRGLNRFDPATGLVAETYRHGPGNAQTLSADLVIAAYQDRAGAVWATTSGGLDRLNPQTGLVTRVAQGPDANTFAQPDEIAPWLMPSAESETGLWFESYGGALLHYDRPTDTVTTLGPESIGDRIVSVAVDRSGTVWAGSVNRGLHKLDRVPQAAVLRHDPDDPGSLSADAVRTVYEPPSTPGILWIGTEAGLDRLDRTTGAITRFTSRPGDTASLTPGTVHAIHEDAAGRLWVGTDGGLSLFDRTTGRVTRTQRDPSDPATLLSDRIRAITSTADAVWLGIDNYEAGGLVRLDPETGAITNYGGGTAGYVPEVYRQILALPDARRLAPAIQPGAEAGTWREAFTLADSAHVLVVGMGEWEGPQEPWDYAWLEDADGQTIWDMDPVSETVATDSWNGNRARANVLRLGPGTYTVRYRALAGHGYGAWTKFAAPSHPDLWGAHVWRLSAEEARALSPLIDQRDENHIEGQESRDLAVGDGRVWVSSDDGGVAGLDPEAGEITVFYSETEGPTSSQGLVWDEDGLWVADYLKGLVRIDPEEGLERIYHNERGAPFAGVTGAITQDREGRIWLGTLDGLVRVDPETGAVRRFRGEHGVPRAQDVNQATRTADGTLFFATDQGVVSVVPSALAGDREPPAVALTGFSLAGEPVAPGPGSPFAEDITVAERVVLGHRQNDFTIRYATLRFDQPEAYATRYRLDGFDADWIEAGTDRRVRYTNLSPGRYTFRVQAANADGEWPETGRQLEVVVRPPWWRSVWAYLLYLGLAVGAVVLGARTIQSRAAAREREKVREAELEQARALEQAREAELAQARETEKAYAELRETQAQLIQSEKMASLGQLTSGIAHEIKNPLNFVNNFASLSRELVDELADEVDPEERAALLADLRRNAETIEAHGKRADAIVRAMMDHARSGSGERRTVRLNALVEEYAGLALHAAQAQHPDAEVDLRFDLDPEAGAVDVVADEIGRVVVNLVDNALGAVRHAASKRGASASNGYAPAVTVATRRLGERAEVRVTDNGPGVPEADRARVFEPFFTTKPTGEGTGLGLSLAHDIVTQGHGGTLVVEDGEGEGEGATFTLALPRAEAA